MNKNEKFIKEAFFYLWNIKGNSCIVWWSNFAFDLLRNVFHMRFVKFYYQMNLAYENFFVSQIEFSYLLRLLLLHNDDKIHCTRYELWISAESQHENVPWKMYIDNKHWDTKDFRNNIFQLLVLSLSLSLCRHKCILKCWEIADARHTK